MRYSPKKTGFTLVELMVSVGITAILMVGIATFFSSTFRNMFASQEKAASTQEEFAVNTILGEKFVNIDKLQALGPALGPVSPYAVLRNDMETGNLPFTYIGKKEIDGADRIVFKDFFVFNGQDTIGDSIDAPLDNPAGIAVLAADAFVALPLENKIYKCDDILANCPEALDMTELEQPLDQPMDITSNSLDTIYVTDAGNGRILEIVDPGGPGQMIRVVASGFNYPTGLAYYMPADTAYLFVADTYNNQVKKVRISDGNTNVVVGDGDDEVCDPSDGRDHTALYCKLSFPTGLMVANDGSGDALYIADTGNDRVLKVVDPAPDLSDYELPFKLADPTQISHVDFVLPDGSVIDSYAEGTSGNSLHTAKYSDAATVITASLTGQMTGSYMKEVCSGGESPSCTNYFRGFYVDSDNNIFETDDDIDISGQGFVVTGVMEEGVGNWKVFVTPLNRTTEYSFPTDIKVTNNFSASDYSFFLDLSAVTIPGGFQQVSIEPFDETSSALAPSSVTLRIGDGELGTFEDTISVVSDGYNFPTDLGWFDGVPQVSDPPQYSTNFSNYDYISDFEVQNFGFSSENDGDILEMKFDANLGQDAEGNPIWEENTLNANVKE